MGYTPPGELPAIDLGYGTEDRRYRFDVSGQPCPMSKWVTPDGREVWLTTRQLQCLYVSLEMGTDEAAYLLGLTPKTVKSHMTKLFRKLGVSTRWEAACDLGWVTVPQALLDAPLGDRET